MKYVITIGAFEFVYNTYDIEIEANNKEEAIKKIKEIKTKTGMYVGDTSIQIIRSETLEVFETVSEEILGVDKYDKNRTTL